MLKALYITQLHLQLFIHLLFCILQEKEKDKNKERDKDAKDKERRSSNGHLFTAIMAIPTILCHQCNKPINTKDAFLCTSKSTSLIIENRTLFYSIILFTILNSIVYSSFLFYILLSYPLQYSSLVLYCLFYNYFNLLHSFLYALLYSSIVL